MYNKDSVLDLSIFKESDLYDNILIDMTLKQNEEKGDNEFMIDFYLKLGKNIKPAHLIRKYYNIFELSEINMYEKYMDIRSNFDLDTIKLKKFIANMYDAEVECYNDTFKVVGMYKGSKGVIELKSNKDNTVIPIENVVRKEVVVKYPNE